MNRVPHVSPRGMNPPSTPTTPPPLHRTGLRRIHAPLPTRLGHGPHVHQTRHLGPYNIPPGAHFFFSQYIMGRTPSTSPTRSASTPTASPRKQSRPPQIHLLPLRRRQPPMHRRKLRLDGRRLLHRHLAQRWRMTYLGTTPPEVQAKITLRPRDPLMMHLDPR
jgi:hypothetical protein